jgi:hypothetical protein
MSPPLSTHQKFESVTNPKPAKAIGVESPAIELRADKVIV